MKPNGKHRVLLIQRGPLPKEWLDLMWLCFELNHAEITALRIEGGLPAAVVSNGCEIQLPRMASRMRTSTGALQPATSDL